MQGFNNTIVLLILFFSTQITIAQTEEERIEITSGYNFDNLNSLSEQFSALYNIQRRKVLEYARENNLDIVVTKQDGGTSLLYKILEDGTPVYLETFNTGSAQTINTDQVHEGGTLGLSLSGKNMQMGIWDGGLVRLTHQEFNLRVAQLDSPENFSNHATHVAGTMIASGVDPAAKGMAYEASLIAYDFNGDIPEMVNEAANGLLISNHSYGFSPSSIPVEWFGAYLSFARSIDQITFNAPYYLPVFAAGNSNNAFPPHNPNKNGYDLISGKNLAKNILTVANVEEVTNYVDPSSVVIWQSSSWGPTDDGRIKPDISAKGRLTYSSIATADDAYSGNYTGTSMAAPAISGSIALLQEHHNNMFGSYLTAASMRGLVLHTAREAGTDPGPDYIFGWGLMNTAEAANVISNKNFTTIIQENTLNDSNTFTYPVEAIDPNTPLVATIAWTDPPGNIQDTSVADDPTPRLVNDLDIKIIAPDAFTEFLPWKLDPSQPVAAATTGDNLVDNVEKIEIPNATGNYTIQISHKGNLQNLSQDYTLIVSGIAENDFVLKSNQSYRSFCANTAAFFNLEIDSQTTFNSNINLSVSGLPASLITNFSANTISNQGQSILNIDGLDTVQAGDYPFTVTATSGSESYSLDFMLNIRAADPLSNPVLTSPLNDGQLSSTIVTLQWDSVSSATSYDVDFSASQNFDSILFSANTEQTAVNVPIELDSDSTYFWRVRPISECVTGNYSVESFNTKPLVCEPIVFANDTPISIPEDTTATLQSVINIPSGTGLAFPVEDVNIILDITHTWLSDLTVTLTSPQGTTITLLEDECSDLDDIDVIFDDKGLNINCNFSSPALQGLIKPKDNLSVFVNEDFAGDWTLTVEDDFNADGGIINNFGIEICVEQFLSNPDFIKSDFSIIPNPSTGIVNLSTDNNLRSKAKVLVFDINGKLLENIDLEFLENTHKLDFSHLSTGIYLLKLQSENQSAVKKLIIK
jgi:subtilisin-like proprotein convertase family protein/subtilisin family serine protease